MKKPDVWFEKRKWKEEKRTDMGSEAKRKPGYLGRAKVRSLLLVSIVGALQDILMVTTDKLIVGNLLGADAVSGTVLISPIFTFGQTFEILVSSGASVLYARAIGNYDDEKRRRVLGMSSMLALAFGLFMCIASFVFQDMIFDALGAEGIIRTYGEEYFYFYRFTFLIIPLFSFLSEIIYIDGDELRSITSGIALLFGNAVLSFIFTKKIGMLGASLGSAIGMVLALIIVLSHFITKKNRIRPIFIFDKSDFMEILIIGSADSTSCIFESLYSFLLNMFIIRVVGEEYLTVLAVTSVIYEMMAIGGGINDAMKTMLLSYWGDKNTKAMKSLLMYGIKETLCIGAVFIVAIWVAAPLFPAAYGIKDAGMSDFTAWACRLTALSTVANVFNGVFLEYYLNIWKYKLYVFGNFLDTFLVRLLLNMLFVLPFGAIGIWIGESICTYVSVAILLWIVYIRYGRDNFPFLIKENGINTLNISLRTVPEDIIDARNTLEEFLKEMRLTGGIRHIASLFLEEMCELLRECNPPDKPVDVDAYFICGRGTMNVVIWSNGEMTDLTDTDRVPEGLAAYLVSFLIRSFEESKYQVTAGYNRASFVIPYKILLREHQKSNKEKEKALKKQYKTR